MMNKLAEIELTNTKLVPPIVKDYLSRKENLRPYINAWHGVDEISSLIEKREFSQESREILVNHLRTQYASAGIVLEDESLTGKNLNLLKSSSTYTITTGHQLNLFGGTLFMSYKILSAIKLASILKQKYPVKNFVPVLWFASEDHDFAEIQSTYLFGKELNWEKDSASQAVGKIDLNGLAEVIQQIQSLIGGKETGTEWIKRIQNAYQDSYDLGKASLKFYHALFEKLGLILIDPNSKDLKKRLIPVMEEDILNQKSFLAQQRTDRELEKLYKLQINARPCNFFYLDDQHGRKLIKPVDDIFEIGDGLKTFTRDEIQNEIQLFPERFSPNVTLRPVFQEIILPNLTYIGGPAEVAYWLQLKSVFEVHHTQFPLVGVRFMQLIAGKGLKEKVEKLGLKLGDLLEDEKTLTQIFIDKSQPLNFQESFEKILDDMQTLVEASRDLDQVISKEFIETKLKLKEFFKNKSGSLKKALELSEENQIDKIIKFRSRLFPKGIFQERIETLMQHEVMADHSLLEEWLKWIEPLSGKLIISEN